MRTRYEEEGTPEVDMAPMIDCVFLLLIFFLIAATIKKKHNELPIELPAAEAYKERKASDDTLVISLYEESGHVAYAVTTIGEKTKTGGGGLRETVSFQELITRMKQAAASRPNREVRIDADKGIPYGAITQVMDHAELYQLNKIGLRTLD